MKYIIDILNLYYRYGWAGLYGLFRPISFVQDEHFKNDGYDLVYIGERSDAYFYGTWNQRKQCFSKVASK